MSLFMQIGGVPIDVIFQYAINRSKVVLGFVGPEREQHIVSELDSALNRWVDSIPNHCKLFY